MTALDYILDGLEAELALERELGVRLVECDRGLLVDAAPSPRQNKASTSIRRDEGVASTKEPVRHSSPSPLAFASSSLQSQPTANSQQPTTSLLPFVFLHDKPLSPAGVEMMAKIITALGTTAEKAPIVFENPVPKAKVYVVLGGLALRKFQPTLKGAPGMWLETAKGAPVLVTYSPEYILRFKEITPAVKKIKHDMWTSLKGVLQRVR